MPKIYDFDKYQISVFSGTTIQIKRKFKKWQISIDVSADVAQKLPKMSYTKFNSLSLKFAWRKSIENHNVYYINSPAFK